MKNKNYKSGLANQSKLNLLIVLSFFIFVGLGCPSFGKKDKVDVNIANSSAPATSPASTPKPTFTKADASKREMPSDAELQEITKETLLEFNEGVQSADFSDFYSSISRAWQRQTSAEKLKNSFQVFIDKNIDISGIRSKDAAFSPAPVIEKELGYNTLKLQGRYPTSPNPTKFVLHYIPEGKDWKLSRIEVDTTGF